MSKKKLNKAELDQEELIFPFEQHVELQPRNMPSKKALDDLTIASESKTIQDYFANVISNDLGLAEDIYIPDFAYFKEISDNATIMYQNINNYLPGTSVVAPSANMYGSQQVQK